VVATPVPLDLIELRDNDQIVEVGAAASGGHGAEANDVATACKALATSADPVGARGGPGTRGARRSNLIATLCERAVGAVEPAPGVGPMRRATTVLAVLMLLVTAAGGAVGPPPSAGASPPAQPVQLPGLRSAARVARDANGIAHIFAASEHDAMFLHGWVHAEDRLFQMDLTRRQASGTEAELVGERALPSDVQARTIGLRRAAARSLEVLSPEGREALQAYADGVNAWVDSHPLPSEYAELFLDEFAPWTPLDSLAIGKAIAFSLSFDLDLDPTLDYLDYLAAGAAGGFDGDALFFEDVFRSAPFDPASTVPDATAPAASESPARASEGRPGAATSHARAAIPDHLGGRAVGALREWRRRIEDASLLAPALHRESDRGSNEWGVAAPLSASGRAMIANDPHLALDAPSTFYPIHLQAGAVDVYGEGFAGVPGVILGHNQFIAWGATTNPMDVTDTFVEQLVADPSAPSGLAIVHQGVREPVEAIPETFRVNTLGAGVVEVPPGGGIPEATLVVPRRNNGPLVVADVAGGIGVSVQFAGFSATRELEAFRVWSRARNLEDFQEGLQFFDFGSQNWAYADARRNIAYFTSGEMPLREDLEAGAVDGLPPFFVRDGTGGNEWLPVENPQPGQALPYEILPPDEMPHVINPAAGWFVNANNDPAGTTLDNDPLDQLRPTGGIYYLSPGYDGFRGGRITEMIRAEIARDGSISFEEMQAMQADVTLLDAEVFVPHLLAAFDGAAGSSTPELATLAADPRVAEAIERLRSWDFTTPTGIAEGYDATDADGQLVVPSDDEIAHSIAATIYGVWRSGVIANTIDATVDGLGLARPGSDVAVADLRHLLEGYATDGGVGASGVDFFVVPGAASPEDERDVLLLRSLAEALDRLAGPSFADAFGGSTDQDDYRWGRLHRVVLDHPLGGDRSIPPAAGAFPQPLPGLPGIPTDGGFNTVDASSHSGRADGANGFMFGGGPVRRFVGEMRAGQRSRTESSLPGGTSGDVGSDRYVTLLPAWLTNESYPQVLRRGALRRTFVDETRYTPVG
jgi:penicillin amidase